MADNSPFQLPRDLPVRLAVAAKLTGIPESSLREKIARGDIPAKRDGSKLILVRLSDLADWFETLDDAQTYIPKKARPQRQPNGEGTPEVLPGGLVRYTGKWNGRRVYGSAKTTYEAAKAAYRDKIREIESPAEEPEPEKPVPTVEEYMWQVLDGPWKARLKHRTLAPSTWQLGEQIYRLNIVGSKLGRKTLGQIVPSELERWADKGGGNWLSLSDPYVSSTAPRV